MEEGAAALDGEVVLGPVPKLAQILVVQGVERVGADGDGGVKTPLRGSVTDERLPAGGIRENLLSFQLFPLDDS